MWIFRRLFGLVAVLFGLVGFLIFLAGLAGLWLGNSHIKEGAVRALDPLEKYSEYAQQQLESNHQRIADIRARLTAMQGQVQQLAAIEPGLFEERLNQLDLDQGTIEFHLQRVEMIIELVRETIAVWTDLGDLGETLPLESLGDLSSSGPLTAELKRANQQLKEFTVILNQVQGKLQNVRAERQQADPPMLNELAGLISRAEMKTGEVQETNLKIRVAMSEINQDVAGLKEKSPAWIDTGSWILTVVLVWMAISQYALMAYGQLLLKS